METVNSAIATIAIAEIFYLTDRDCYDRWVQPFNLRWVQPSLTFY